jgi:large repetitive protein
MLLRKAGWLPIAMAACASYICGQTTVPTKLSAAAAACRPFPSNTFYPQSNVPVILTGDVNGDGIPDLVSVSRAGVVVLIGNGNGTFKAGTAYALGGADFSQGAVAGDFNHDGKLDIAVATSPAAVGQGPSTVNVFLGNGDGTFQVPLKSPVQTGISFLAAGDFNHDGNLDLAGVSYAGSGATPVEVLLGKGDGTFQAPATYNVAALSWAITVADFNGDGNLDLAVTNTGNLEASPQGASHTVSVFLGKGDGTFGPATLFQTGLAPVGILAEDLNGDGKIDLATANYVSGTTSVLRGNGDGTFGTPVSYLTGHAYSPYYVAAIQFGNVQQSGLVVQTLAGVFSLVNNGNGTFRTAQGYNPGGAGSLVVADFNGDGKADVALAAGDGSSGDGIAVLLGKGNGAFATSSAYVAVPDLIALAEGDFNGDGIPDLAVGGSDSDLLGIMLGNGKGAFSRPINQYTLPENITAIAVGDVNGDGKLDLAVARDPGVVQILLGNGDGSFSVGSSFDLYSESPPILGVIALADFNGDGVLDIAVTSPGAFNGSPGVVSILLGNGNGTFQPAVGYAVEQTFSSTDVLGGLVIADFNGDGKLDFAVGDNVLNMLRVFLGNGDGTFRAGPETPVPPQVNSLAVADFNGDGLLDVAVGSSTIQILLGKGDGSFKQGATVNVGGGWVTAADFNEDGRIDLVSLVSAEQMEFLPGSGNGSFGPGVLTFTAVGPYQLALGDLNGDGLPDLVTAGSQGGAVSVLLNHCGGR